jgi:hypothetical protein
MRPLGFVALAIPQADAGRVQTEVFSFRKGIIFVAHRLPDKAACTGESWSPKSRGR